MNHSDALSRLSSLAPRETLTVTPAAAERLYEDGHVVRIGGVDSCVVRALPAGRRASAAIWRLDASA